MVSKILFVVLGIAYCAVNILTAKTHSATEMHNKFVTGQCIVGRIFTNVFYAPAWALKILRSIVLALVK